MLGIDDFWVWSAYLLSVLSALLCVAYGIVSKARHKDVPPPGPEDVAWAQEEQKIDEGL